MAIGFYITDQTTNQTIQLPINPSEVKVKYETDDKQETITNLGEVNLIGKDKLASISIQSTFADLSVWYPHYMSTYSAEMPESYLDSLNKIREEGHKVRFIVTGTEINLLMTIHSFEYGMEKGFADEYVYTIDLMQYREFGYQKLKDPKKKGKKKGKKRSKPAKKISKGAKVKVNGRLHADSYGKGAGMYEKNAKREVLYIVPGRKYPVCVGINGKARGWVKMSEVKRV